MTPLNQCEKYVPLSFLFVNYRLGYCITEGDIIKRMCWVRTINIYSHKFVKCAHINLNIKIDTYDPREVNI